LKGVSPPLACLTCSLHMCVLACFFTRPCVCCRPCSVRWGAGELGRMMEPAQCAPQPEVRGAAAAGLGQILLLPKVVQAAAQTAGAFLGTGSAACPLFPPCSTGAQVAALRATACTVRCRRRHHLQRRDLRRGCASRISVWPSLGCKHAASACLRCLSFLALSAARRWVVRVCVHTGALWGT